MFINGELFVVYDLLETYKILYDSSYVCQDERRAGKNRTQNRHTHTQSENLTYDILLPMTAEIHF